MLERPDPGTPTSRLGKLEFLITNEYRQRVRARQRALCRSRGVSHTRFIETQRHDFLEFRNFQCEEGGGGKATGVRLVEHEGQYGMQLVHGNHKLYDPRLNKATDLFIRGSKFTLKFDWPGAEDNPLNTVEIEGFGVLRLHLVYQVWRHARDLFDSLQLRQHPGFNSVAPFRLEDLVLHDIQNVAPGIWWPNFSLVTERARDEMFQTPGGMYLPNMYWTRRNLGDFCPQLQIPGIIYADPNVQIQPSSTSHSSSNQQTEAQSSLIRKDSAKPLFTFKPLSTRKGDVNRESASTSKNADPDITNYDIPQPAQIPAIDNIGGPADSIGFTLFDPIILPFYDDGAPITASPRTAQFTEALFGDLPSPHLSTGRESIPGPSTPAQRYHPYRSRVSTPRNRQSQKHAQRELYPHPSLSSFEPELAMHIQAAHDAMPFFGSLAASASTDTYQPFPAFAPHHHAQHDLAHAPSIDALRHYSDQYAEETLSTALAPQRSSFDPSHIAHPTSNLTSMSNIPYASISDAEAF
ncbi:hypothetical protein SISNIDRAFT_457145 [Sistotremastrum niveocremeum HHB9708]|uniref:Uncharacterized protein n=1 Tax=Sistotremastrum niveocremeum HHB9708 TaxID=1314777 RepID=A0A164S4L7_9AGAM|nr:hypothetical protein SISNIDRAFT_457145 [Sistotremastrum niveocremeum HHB9708]